MMRAVAGLCALLAVGVPLVASPTQFVATVAAAIALLCAVGVLLPSASIVTAGASLALVEYTLVIWRSGRPPSFFAAIGFGVLLLLLVQITDFAARFGEASSASPVVRSQVRYWCRLGGAGAVIAMLVLVLATTLAVLVRLPLAPLVAGAAALVAFAGVVGALRRT